MSKHDESKELMRSFLKEELEPIHHLIDDIGKNVKLKIGQERLLDIFDTESDVEQPIRAVRSDRIRFIYYKFQEVAK